MNLNKYNIQKLIAWKNIQPTKLEKRQRKVSILFGGIATLVAIFSPAKAFFAGVAIVSFAKPFGLWMKYARRRFYASRKLTKIVRKLEQSGIHTTKLKLEKAVTFSIQNYNDKLLEVEQVHTTFFKDTKEELKAFRQIRSELVSLPYSYADCIRDAVKEAKCESIDPQKTEVIEDSEKVKQLLLEIRTGK